MFCVKDEDKLMLAVRQAQVVLFEVTAEAIVSKENLESTSWHLCAPAAAYGEQDGRPHSIAWRYNQPRLQVCRCVSRGLHAE